MENRPTETERLRFLVDRLDCFTEADFGLLADATPLTVEAWRKRGTGPEYILIGKRYLYSRKSVAEFLESKRRTRSHVDAKSVL